MSEQEIIQNLLINLKHMKSFLATFSQEASGDIEQVVDTAYDEISTLQRNCFNLMVNEKWMKVQYQTQSAIDKLYQQYKDKEC